MLNFLFPLPPLCWHWCESRQLGHGFFALFSRWISFPAWFLAWPQIRLLQSEGLAEDGRWVAAAPSSSQQPGARLRWERWDGLEVWGAAICPSGLQVLVETDRAAAAGHSLCLLLGKQRYLAVLPTPGCCRASKPRPSLCCCCC